MKNWISRIALPAMLMATLSGPASAADAEMAYLSSYIGNWRGESVLTGGEKPEPFRCRLTIAKGNQSKINYAGRCTLINMNLSVSGTIAFSDEHKRFEAAMSSNAGFSGVAVGVRQGDRISFDLKQRQADRGGNDVRIGSRIILLGNSITVDYEVEFNESGDVLVASVPFSK
ncbi:heme-binding beta-barrel domain-containing protein [Paradevosia shaoguanensis]|jgi:hypothetical protein|nr:heme-binding beta-barrel domain-containing protein [Paradevosia shaoguanensis]KFL25103.1 hypothetical protein JP74_20925 [Devosia sp. 17-2-E-8]QMV02838.1 DUF1794 domain-containing protein [Devosia sp. D6-9]CDP52707.1 hypothetical protein [Devosia sp. DBB001]